jgi:hypothetical protein
VSPAPAGSGGHALWVLCVLLAAGAAAAEPPAPLVEAPEGRAIAEASSPTPPSYWEKGLPEPVPLPSAAPPRHLQFEDLEFLLLQPLHLALVGASIDWVARSPGVFGVLGLTTGLGLALHQFSALPPAIYAHAINSGTLWGAWLMAPLAVQAGNPALSGLGSLAGAIAFGLWAHHGGLSPGQLAMINSAGVWAAIGGLYASLVLQQQFGPGPLNSLGLTIATGGSLAAGALTAWAARHVRLHRAQVLLMDLGGVAGLIGSWVLLGITYRPTGGIMGLPTSAAAMYAALPLTGAVLFAVLLHLDDQGKRREAALEVQLAPVISDRQQGLALMGTF